ncbi:MAG: sulfatase-like hydrolase/transferase [Planctomycetota bacterium]|jgi:arylsulfatase A-like enzyme
MRTIHLTPAVVLVLAVAIAAEGPAKEEAPDTKKPRRPNVVLIVADDLGYADVGFHGCEDVPTPSIDSIAAGGVRFTNGYVTCSVCSPTRAGLVTGRYQQRFGHEFNTGGIREDWSDVGLPVSETTLAEVLDKAGYATGAVGKWHLGREGKFHPQARGFDEFFGFLGGGRSYFDRTRGESDTLLRGREAVPWKEYLTDAFGREAEAFVKRHKEEPFFLYLTFNAVHTPMQATQDYLDRFPKVEGTRRTYAAMLSSMDDAIGRVLTALSTHGLREDTLVVFLSDNGGPTRANASRNDPLRGGKGSMYEGGIRVPLAIRWPGRLPKGAVYEKPVVSLDLFATAVAAAGAKPPEGRRIDGVDLLPHLAGKTDGLPHETLYWRTGDRFAIRHGDFKLLRERSGDLELYDLSTDPAESTNLLEKRADKARELSRLYVRWEKETVGPRWAAPVRKRQQRRAGGAPKIQDLVKRFAELDKDGNGKLSAEELGRPRLVRRADRDGDGQLTLEELKAHLASRKSR